MPKFDPDPAETAQALAQSECTALSGHLPGTDHRTQECPTYHDDDD